MRVFLLLIILQASTFCIAQNKGFWQLMPDSVQQKQYLKNWKLNGPVKQVIVKDYNNLGGRRHEVLIDAQPMWDTLSESYLEKYRDLHPHLYEGRHDTIKFDSVGNLYFLYFAKNGDNNDLFGFALKESIDYEGINCFNENCTLVYNDQGKPKYIIGSNGDTLNYHYYENGKLVSIDYSNGIGTIDAGYFWIYSNDTTYMLFKKDSGDPKIIRQRLLQYNKKGQLLLKREYQDKKFAKWSAEYNVTPIDSFFIDVIYGYDSVGNLVYEKLSDPMFREISYYDDLGEKAVVNRYYIDSTVQHYKYNDKGQLVEKDEASYNGFETVYDEHLNGEVIVSRRTVAYEYDHNGSLIKRTRNVWNRRKEIYESSFDELIYWYDEYQNPTKMMEINTYQTFEGEWRKVLLFVQLVQYEYYK